MRPCIAIRESVRPSIRPERADFKPEMVNVKPERAVFRPERDGGGGQTDKGMKERTIGQTNKSPPVFYRTSSPLGPLPKSLI